MLKFAKKNNFSVLFTFNNHCCNFVWFKRILLFYWTEGDGEKGKKYEDGMREGEEVKVFWWHWNEEKRNEKCVIIKFIRTNDQKESYCFWKNKKKKKWKKVGALKYRKWNSFFWWLQFFIIKNYCWLYALFFFSFKSLRKGEKIGENWQK